jgi:hypothetical protein
MTARGGERAVRRNERPRHPVCASYKRVGAELECLVGWYSGELTGRAAGWRNGERVAGLHDGDCNALEDPGAVERSRSRVGAMSELDFKLACTCGFAPS